MYAGNKIDLGSAVPPSRAAAVPSVALPTASQKNLHTLGRWVWCIE